MAQGNAPRADWETVDVGSAIPMPPLDDLHDDAHAFVPAPDLAAWATETFVAEGADLLNEDHAHLRNASIGFLWTGVENTRKGRRVIGTAELGFPQGAMGKWAKARAVQQVMEWFGAMPDFIVTVDGTWWEAASDAERCALIEHELYHCAQETDEFGAPKFNRQTGAPVYGMRGHDVEEFVGVVRRYGADAAGVRELVDAANADPEVAPAAIARGCGVCLKAA